MGTPFVGRRRELAIVAAACTEASAGHRRLIAVRGDAGIGKTSFAEQAAEVAEQAGFAVVWGRCWPHGGAPPLWPWQPILAELLGPSGAHLLDDDHGSSEVDPERFARFQAVAERLTEVLRDRPLMIIVDDVHDADAAALLLTRFLCRALARQPLVVMVTRRPADLGAAETERLLSEIEAEAVAVHLASFDLRETIALLTSRGMDSVDPNLVLTLLRVTAGNPLLLSRALAAGTAGEERATVAVAIGEAVANLPSAERTVLAFAAVLGPSATISEIAAVAGDPQAFVVDAMRQAEAAGLVRITRDECHFSHALIRDAALDTLSTVDLLDAHAAATALLAADERSERVIRRAHHALAATARSDDDAAIAVDACRRAAAVLRRGFDDEGAATLLTEAVALADRLAPRPEWTEVPLELARTLQSCGRLAAAREAFDHAATVAEAQDDVVAFAKAAIGLGGVWLNEHRDPLAHERVLGLQRRALARLAATPDQDVLRARLEMRLAAEAVYAGAPPDEARRALAAARAVGDGTTLAEALSLTHHALLAPGRGRELLALSEEQVTVASASGEAMLTVLGLMWRVVDLFQLGDARADRALNELRHRVDAIGCRSIAYIVAVIDVMRLIRAGRLEDAEAAATESLALGTEVGDSDAMPYFAAHLLTIRFLQDRDSELFETAMEVAASPELMSRERGLQATVAVLAARAGKDAQARVALAELADDDFAALAPSSTSLAALVSMVEAVSVLGDADLARRLHAGLLPFAELSVTPSLATTCLGSVERALGLAAIAAGDRDAATGHLLRALEANRRLGHLPMVAMTTADLARWCTDSASRAAALLEQAAADADSFGMPLRAEAWRAEAARLAQPSTDDLSLRRDGNRWVAAAGGRRIDLPDLVGFGYLKALVERPGQDVPAAELCGSRLVDGSHHELLDRTTLNRFRDRVRELDAEIDEADADADVGRAERLRMERDALREELSRTLSLAGRQRTFVDTSERARTAVHKAVKRALEAIADRDPTIGEMLRERVTTGTICRYDPAPQAVSVPGRGHRS